MVGALNGQFCVFLCVCLCLDREDQSILCTYVHHMFLFSGHVVDVWLDCIIAGQ